MNYIILYIFVTVYSCSKTTFGSPSRKPTIIYIDDFIGSLLSSPKFDELADKIADKAVQKLANVQVVKGELDIEENNINSDADSTEVTTLKPEKRLNKNLLYKERAKDNISNNGIEEKQATEEPHTPKLNKIELRIEQGDAKYKETAKTPVTKDESKETQEEVVIEEVRSPVPEYKEQNDAGYEERAKKPVSNDNKGKPGKINTEALLNDEDPDQPKLLLKYKHFKKLAQQKKARNTPLTAGETNDVSKTFRISVHNTEKSNEDKDQIAKHSSSKLDSTEKNNKRNTRIRLRGRKDFEDSGEDEREVVPDNNIRKPLLRDGKYVKQAYQSPPSFLIRTTRQYYEYEDNEKTALRNGPVLKQNYTESRSNEADLETTPAPVYEHDEETTRKRIIRKEGNKYYTYLSGPEYEEFQMELQKQADAEAEAANEVDKLIF